MFRRAGGVPVGVFLLLALGAGSCMLFKRAAVRPAPNTFFVAPNGNDAWSGTRPRPNRRRTDGPFATLTRARDTIRARRRAGGLVPGPVAVTIRGGRYRIEQTLELAAEDSGAEGAPVVWQAYPGETVRLVGGVRLTGFGPVTDPPVRKRLAAAARDHVQQTDLRRHGIRDLGIVNPKGGRRAELFFDNRYMTLARYPNEGWLRIADVPQEGELKFRGMYRGPNPVMRDGMPGGRHYGRFVYEGDRPSRWQWHSDLWMLGYWVVDFREEYNRVQKLDPRKKEVWPAPPYGGYGYAKGGRYCFLNVLEELDRPGEWFLDRTTGILYFWPPSPAAEAEVTFPVLEKPMVALKDAKHVHIQGIVFECSRAGAVTIAGGSHNLVAGCTIRNVGGTAIRISGGTHNGVRSCDIYEVGAGGIQLHGGDRKTLTPAHHYAENCHIHHFARVHRTYRPAVHIAGVGNRVSHCSIHDCPHGGIGYTGNDHVVEYCELARTGLETGDVGALYTAMDWTYRGHVLRYNYFHDIHSPPRTHVGSMTIYLDLPCGGAHIHGSVFHDMQRAFFTNSGRDCLIENNIFVQCNPSIHFSSWRDAQYFRKGGPWKMVERLHAVGYDKPPYSTRYPQLLRLFKDGDPAIPTGNVVRRNVSTGGRFLQLHPLVDFADVRVESNLIGDPIVFMGSPTGDGKSAQYRNADERIRAALAKAGNVVVAGDVGLADVEAEDFRLRPDSPAWKLGFQPIPFDKIGLQTDEHRTSLPARPPSIGPDPRLFVGELEVRIVPSRRGPASVIRYTLDGTEPSRRSPRYSRPIRLTRTTTVKAAAFAKGGRAGDRSGAVAATFTAGKLGRQHGVYLSGLPGLDVLAHAGLKRDANYTGGTITLCGRKHPRGIMLCPEATRDGGIGHVTYVLDGGLDKARRFVAVIGIEDAMKVHQRGSATFAVEARRNGQWQRLFESPVLTLGQTQSVDVDISGADRLRLLTTDGGDDINCDHAVWADARLQ